MNWRELAACYGMDTNLFFPQQGRPEAAAAAKSVCLSCSVRTQCRAEAVDQGERGIWGGTNDDERRELRTRQVVA
jgi:WhiB family transcriptional regulator, redox-sensing transcriptional regulator